AQVGINTENPRPETALDINGNVNITDRIYLGGTDLNSGNDGEDKASIISGGETDSPEWKKLQIPSGFGESFTMTYMNTYYDAEGVNLVSNGAIPYDLDQDINETDNDCPTGDCWKIITGLNNEFVIYKPGNKINFMFQTTAQINNANLSSFACGLFLNSPSNPDTFTLKGVRTDVVNGSEVGNYKLFNMNVTLENLPVPGGAGGTTYKVRVACRGRTIQTDNFGIGKPVNTTLNSDMAQSTLNVFVLESWE